MRCNNGRIDTKNFCVSQGRFFFTFPQSERSQSGNRARVIHHRPLNIPISVSNCQWYFNIHF